ncbi:MAG: class I SAM-dependent methyltransferase [Rhizobiaceae bacterium]
MDILFDRRLLAVHKLRAARRPNSGSDFLIHRACSELADRLAIVDRRFEHAISLISAHDLVAQTLIQSGKVDRITTIEADSKLLYGQSGIVEPEEVVPLAEQSADLAVSLFALHEINDVPGYLAQIRRALRADGLLLAAFSGAGTLAELRECMIAAETELSGGAAARIYPFMDVRDAGALLQRAGFALPVTDVESVVARYDSALDVMHDLRAMGAGNALIGGRRPLTRGILDRIEEIYADRFSDPDGRLRATFNTIWISGWVPHASQQKPLKPGSATTRLDEALQQIKKSQAKKPE